MLYWGIIKKSCVEGFSKFFFGRSSWESGPFKFKKQWGAVPEEMNYNIYSKSNNANNIQNNYSSQYGFFRKCWRKMPVPLANFFGPQIIKRIP